MKMNFRAGPSLFFAALMGLPSAAFSQDFNGVSWSRDRSNTPERDQSGCGSTPSPTTGTGTIVFELDGCSSGTQRQEFKYERRTGFHSMTGVVRFEDPDISGGIAIAQTHDDRTGSPGVFTIYQVRRSGSRYYVMPQTDHSGRSQFSWARVYPNTDYYFKIETFSDGDNSYERAQLFRGTSTQGTRIGNWWIRDGSGDDEEQYKKIGAYQLSSSSGSIRIEWRNVRFYTGRR